MEIVKGTTLRIMDEEYHRVLNKQKKKLPFFMGYFFKLDRFAFTAGVELGIDLAKIVEMEIKEKGNNTK